MYFYWQVLIILFVDDRAKKIWNYTSYIVLWERKKYISGAADFGAAARRGHGFHTQPSKIAKSSPP